MSELLVETLAVCPRCFHNIRAGYVPDGSGGRVGLTECGCPEGGAVDAPLVRAHRLALDQADRWQR